MRNHWYSDIAVRFFSALCVGVFGLAMLVMVVAVHRDIERNHEAKMASCTTTIPKTDSARVGQ